LKPTVAQLVKKLSALYETRGFITMFTTASQALRNISQHAGFFMVWSCYYPPIPKQDDILTN